MAAAGGDGGALRGRDAVKSALAPLGQLRAAAAEFASVSTDIEERQKQSLTAKKKLADDTKQFKRIPEEEKLGAFNDLLKSYQAEIDSLSKRAKFAEATFGQLQQTLSWVPDPVAVNTKLEPFLNNPGVQALETQVAEKDATIGKLREAAQTLEAELMQCANQETAVRRLKKQVKDLEAASMDRVAEMQHQKDDEWAKRIEDLYQEQKVEKSRHEQALALVVQERNEHSEQLERLRQQRLEERRLAEESVMGKAMEVDALNNDLDRLQAELEQERLKHSGGDDCREKQGSVEVFQSLLETVQSRAAVSEREAADLRSQLRVRDADARQSPKADPGQERQVEELRAQLAAMDANVANLQEQLAYRPSHEEVTALKMQLQNVKTVEVTDLDGASTDLECRLLQKQKTLEIQLSETRVRSQALEEETVTLRAKNDQVDTEVTDLRKLANRLEKELANAAQGGSSFGLNALLPEATRVATADATPCAAFAASVGTSDGGPAESMPSMLDIVTGQRDRLRERAGDLEQERDRWKADAELERKRAAEARKDNVRLLERTRYLQSLQPKQGSFGKGRARGAAAAGSNAEVEDRYAAAYEEGLGPIVSPFEEFKQGERSRRIDNLSAGERLLVNTGALILASKPARMCTLIYVAALHAMVWLVLWWNHTHQHC